MWSAERNAEEVWLVCEELGIAMPEPPAVVVVTARRARVRRDPERQAAIRGIVADRKRACSHCGEGELRIIEFHHIDRATKRGDVADMLREGWDDDAVRDELARCVCLCLNCHRKLHLGLWSLADEPA